MRHYSRASVVTRIVTCVNSISRKALLTHVTMQVTTGTCHNASYYRRTSQCMSLLLHVTMRVTTDARHNASDYWCKPHCESQLAHVKMRVTIGARDNASHY